MAGRGVSLSICAGLLVAGLIGSVASAATREQIEVTTSKTAWYAQAPPCAAIDCSVLPLVHPYPEDTLHVSISGGQETARTYLAFPTFVSGRLVGGTLELPLDDDPAGGSVTPESAHFVACLTKTKFEPVRGSFAQPPKADCKVRKTARYDAEDLVFTVDLAPFAKHWKKDEGALALVPSKGAVEAGETWHVTFPAGEDEADPAEQQPAPEITVTLEYMADDVPSTIDTTFELDTTDPPAASAGTGTGTTSSSGTSFDSGTGFTASQPATEVSEVGTPTELPAQEAAPAASFIEGFAGPGFAYPMVWALPLLILVGLGSVGRALTKELYRRGV